ncbi:MAG: hypothetical protein J6T10_11545 [Methanobrevibacter sp.]|nr:hypothetical protein [Methanobrevibacter sp.]
MIYWTKYRSHVSDIRGKNKKFDNTIYTFDIETTSYFELNGRVYPPLEYDKLSDDEKHDAIKKSCMYVWQFGINDTVYYGRTWQEFQEFLKRVEMNAPYKKIIFVHNLAFEFQYLKSYFSFSEVVARKSHKVMSAILSDYNITFKCSYFMSNVGLEKLSSVYNLPVEKQVGNLDYSKLRHSETELTEQELKYCEYDCLVVYYYILRELEVYETVNKIPNTSTGHVRREFSELVMKDYRYKSKVRRAINTDPHVYNLMVQAFAGGYTHANYMYTDEIIRNVDSYDETSAYPYVMTTYKYPSTEFRKSLVKNVSQMSSKLAYILVVKLKNVRSKYYNNFLSSSKCRHIKGGKYDNGRIIECDELETTLTDIDFKLILDAYKCEYEIIESYFSIYAYLPKQFIKFILDKYVIKTEYKDLEGKELEYQLEKAKFNALYGMSVTNTIRDNVIFDDDTKLFSEVELTNDEIIEKLNAEKKKAFLSFAYGVWVTAYARNNLIRRVMDLDEYVIYCDTDSIKLARGYDKTVIEKYNESVVERINNVSEMLGFDKSLFAPKDIKGNEHMLGLFEHEHLKGYSEGVTYDEFITQGAKKYAFKKGDKISITVAGVPKKAGASLKTLNDFRDGYVFTFKDTEKSLLFYVENQSPTLLTDYLGKEYLVTDISGACLLPNTYTLDKALDYTNLISDSSSKRSMFKESEEII